MSISRGRKKIIYIYGTTEETNFVYQSLQREDDKLGYIRKFDKTTLGLPDNPIVDITRNNTFDPRSPVKLDYDKIRNSDVLIFSFTYNPILYEPSFWKDHALHKTLGNFLLPQDYADYNILKNKKVILFCEVNDSDPNIDIKELKIAAQKYIDEELAALAEMPKQKTYPIKFHKAVVSSWDNDKTPMIDLRRDIYDSADEKIESQQTKEETKEVKGEITHDKLEVFRKQLENYYKTLNKKKGMLKGFSFNKDSFTDLDKLLKSQKGNQDIDDVVKKFYTQIVNDIYNSYQSYKSNQQGKRSSFFSFSPDRTPRKQLKPEDFIEFLNGEKGEKGEKEIERHDRTRMFLKVMFDLFSSPSADKYKESILKNLGKDQCTFILKLYNDLYVEKNSVNFSRYENDFPKIVDVSTPKKIEFRKEEEGEHPHFG